MVLAMSDIVLFLYRLAFLLSKGKIPFLPSIIVKLIRIVFGCQIGLGAQIGRGCNLGYGGLGIVIHSATKICDYVQIGTNVTIGGKARIRGIPEIGNRCVIGTGAKILGPIKVGDGSFIGANAVLIKDVPSRSLVVGVPGKIVKTQIDINQYL